MNSHPVSVNINQIPIEFRKVKSLDRLIKSALTCIRRLTSDAGGGGGRDAKPRGKPVRCYANEASPGTGKGKKDAGPRSGAAVCK